MRSKARRKKKYLSVTFAVFIPATEWINEMPLEDIECIFSCNGHIFRVRALVGWLWRAESKWTRRVGPFWGSCHRGRPTTTWPKSSLSWSRKFALTNLKWCSKKQHWTYNVHLHNQKEPPEKISYPCTKKWKIAFLYFSFVVKKLKNIIIIITCC